VGDALEGRLGYAKLDELGEKIAAEFLCEAGAGAAGVDEGARRFGAALYGRVVAEEEGSDAVGAFAGEGKARDDEFLLVEAFGLEPIASARAAVGSVGSFGDDAFGVEGAGFAEDGFAVARDVFGEADGFVVGWEDRGEELFAFA